MDKIMEMLTLVLLMETLMEISMMETGMVL